MAMSGRLDCGCPRSDYAIRSAGAFVVSRSTYSPACTLGAHTHVEDRIVLTAYGTFGSTYANRAFDLDARRTIYRPAQVEHRDRYVSETACITIRLPASDGARSQAFEFADEDMPGTTRRLWTELDSNDTASELAIESLSAEILARLASRPEREVAAPRWICRVRDWVEDEYADPPALRTIARGVDRDVSHVAATFRRVYGKSVGEFVRDVRVWRTRSLLEDVSLSLAEVAARGGFADQSHFTRLFKRRFAMTPGEYRLRVGALRRVG